MRGRACLTVLKSIEIVFRRLCEERERRRNPAFFLAVLIYGLIR
jgi:hypothetical protein